MDSEIRELRNWLLLSVTFFSLCGGYQPLNFIVYQGGLCDGYKNYIAEKEIPDDTYNEEGVALFRIQGSGPEDMQAIQVDPVCV